MASLFGPPFCLRGAAPWASNGVCESRGSWSLELCWRHHLTALETEWGDGMGTDMPGSSCSSEVSLAARWPQLPLFFQGLEAVHQDLWERRGRCVESRRVGSQNLEADLDHPVTPGHEAGTRCKSPLGCVRGANLTSSACQRLFRFQVLKSHKYPSSTTTQLLPQSRITSIFKLQTSGASRGPHSRPGLLTNCPNSR